VAPTDSWAERRTRWLNRFHARRAGFGPVASGFVSQPEPRSIGSFYRGRQLSAGNFLFAGFLVEAPETPIWDLPMPDGVFEAEVQGFVWLDDLAAVGDRAAQKRAQHWTHDWVARYGQGEGPGWTPDLAGRRLVRWINHAILLLNGASGDENRAFFAALTRQTRFLARRWHAASPGLPRFEALTGLVYAGLSLTGMQRHVRPAVQALKDLGMHRKVQLIVSGGIRNGADVAKALALGADATSIGTAALVALGDNDPHWEEEYRAMGTTAGAYDDWHEGRDPAGITTQDPALAARLDPVAAGRRLANYLNVLTLELQTIARACGKSHVLNLEPEDLVALTVESAAMAGVPLAGTDWVPGRY